MENIGCDEELRWHVMKSMLDEFPTLKTKVKAYVEKQSS